MTHLDFFIARLFKILPTAIGLVGARGSLASANNAVALVAFTGNAAHASAWGVPSGREFVMLKGLVFSLLFSLLAACASTPDKRGLGPNEVLLQVVASGEAEARPDLARFSAGVSSIAATSETATKANNTKMGKVMAAVEALGVKADDTRTEAVNITRIDWGRNKGQFEASNTVSIKVRKVDDAGKVIAAATAAGANIVSGPDLTIDDREAASKGAYAAAFKAARTRADAYAEAAGLKVKRVLTITDGSAMNQPMPYGSVAQDAVMEQAASPPPVIAKPASITPIRPGLTTSTAHVRVDFVLGN